MRLGFGDYAFTRWFDDNDGRVLCVHEVSRKGKTMMMMAIGRDVTPAEGNSAGDAVLLSEHHVGPKQCERHGSRAKLSRMWQTPTFLRYLRRKHAGPGQ